MKYLILTAITGLLLGCGRASFKAAGTKPLDSCTIQDNFIVCPDGTRFDLDQLQGDDGKDGQDGVDGEDGKDAVILTTVNVSKGSCTQVYDGIWVENINADVFDVYYNPNCNDNQGEYCDNVRPSYGKHGSIDKEHGRGSATTCWADGIELQGHKQSKNTNDILIILKDYK